MCILDTSARTSRKKSSWVSLDKGFDHKLFAYAAAASAAGVAAISLAQPCQAEIVYTKTRQVIDPNSSYSLDLNNDGIVDFTITNWKYSSCRGPECVEQNLWVQGAGTNQVWNNYSGNPRAYAAARRSIVGPGDNFFGYGLMDRCKGTRTSYYTSGSWVDVQRQYLGFAFSIDGQTHYGCARLNAHVRGLKCKSSVVLTGFAYETVAGKPIGAGIMNEKNNIDADGKAPAGSLGGLALGSAQSRQPDSRESEK